MASEDAIIRMFAIFKEMWPNRETTTKTASLYKLILDDISDEDLMLAALNCAKTCKFFPTPSEIEERTSSGILAPEQAFALVLETTSERDLPPALLSAVKNLGGLQFMKEQPHYVIRRHFLDAYKEFVKTTQRDESRERFKALLPNLDKTIKLIEGGK